MHGAGCAWLAGTAGVVGSGCASRSRQPASNLGTAPWSAQRCVAMAQLSIKRQRCTECGCWYRPHPRAVKTQKICGAKACRVSRRRKLARRRRRRELDLHRDAERDRQRKSREARGQRTCHAPPSAPKCPQLRKKLMKMWDQASAMSRATLLRSMPGILREMERSTEIEIEPPVECHAPP